MNCHSPWPNICRTMKRKSGHLWHFSEEKLGDKDIHIVFLADILVWCCPSSHIKAGGLCSLSHNKTALENIPPVPIWVKSTSHSAIDYVRTRHPRDVRGSGSVQGPLHGLLLLLLQLGCWGGHCTLLLLCVLLPLLLVILLDLEVLLLEEGISRRSFRRRGAVFSLNRLGILLLLVGLVH